MLPIEFTERMKRLLKNDFDAFSSALESNAVKALRLTSFKGSPCDIEALCGIRLSKIPYVKDGYIIEDGAEGLGNSAAHHAGMFYMQDPGAMISAEAVDIDEGMWVADLCAAPGGKSTQAAAKIGESGFLLSNEYVPKRAKILVGNLERLGIKNAMVTSLDTSRLAELYTAVFDVVITDAPCSGEGMFRKCDEALTEWSEENVLLCKRRQSEILNNAAALVKSGGALIYSTCTYSTEENEMVVDEFLSTHPDFYLTDATERVRAVTADGVTFDGAISRDLSKCRRFYPHVSRGEGQFVAVMRWRSEICATFNYKDNATVPKRDILDTVEAFFRDNLVKRPEGRILKVSENIVLISHGCPVLPYSVFSSGVLIGEIRGKNLFPSHHFLSAYGNLFKRQVNLTDADAVRSYLKGEEIPDKYNTGNGFCAVCYHGFTLGGGKISGGMIKNHYPKGLRL
jgi:16S rRNA C967 or C1407 C5-methylase (RsmB/RsmF family)/NOL1/NOP2/fmu family ribosome biogenesis protein